jgi:hypothetical protein
MIRVAPRWIAAVLMLAGCGSADQGVDVPASLAAAVAATVDAATGRTESVTVVEMSERTWTTRSTGIHDYRRDRSEMTYELEEHRTRTIVVGGTSYAELDAAQAFEVAPGKRWVRSDPLTEASFEELSSDDCGTDDAAEGEEMYSCSAHVFLVEVSSTEADDPAKTLESVAEYGSPLSVIGPEDVRGVPTMHVRTHVDFRRAAEASYREEGWSSRNIERALESVPTTLALVDVWVDGDGLVRRVRTSQSYEPPEREGFPELPGDWGSFTSITTTEFFDFGVDVDIHTPPESEVVDSDEWMREAMERAEHAPPPPFEPDEP